MHIYGLFVLIETHVAIKLYFRKILIYVLKIDIRFICDLLFISNYYHRKISILEICCDCKTKRIFV